MIMVQQTPESHRFHAVKGIEDSTQVWKKASRLKRASQFALRCGHKWAGLRGFLPLDFFAASTAASTASSLPYGPSPSSKRRQRRARQIDRTILLISGASRRLNQHHSVNDKMSEQYEKIAGQVAGGLRAGPSGRSRERARPKNNEDWTCRLCKDSDGNCDVLNRGLSNYCWKCNTHKGTCKGKTKSELERLAGVEPSSRGGGTTSESLPRPSPS